METTVLRRAFSVDEFHRMADAGVFGEEDRLELLDGEIVQMTPIGSRHAACVARLNEWLVEHLRASAIVNVQNPLVLGDRTEVYPDIALLERRSDFYSRSLPQADDVRLIIEVADTTGDYDRRLKLPRYARAGIPELWIVDLQGRALDISREPRGHAYDEHRRLGSGQTAAIPGFVDRHIPVADVLG